MRVLTCTAMALAEVVVGGLVAAAPPPDVASLQNPQYLRDHAETRGFTLGRPTHAVPTPSGDAVLFLRGQARTPKLELYEFNVRTGETRLLLTPEDILQGAAEKLSPEEKALRERMRVSVGGFTGFQLTQDGSKILLSLSGKLYVVDRQSRAVQELKTGQGSPVDPKFSLDAKKVAYVLEHDVFVYDLTTGQEKAVTSGGNERVSHGLAEFVAREEMDRFSGYWWAPDGQSIAYQESDATGVEVWYVADPAKPGEAPYPSYYPRPGKRNVQVRIGVAPVGGGETVWLKWDREQYPYVTTVQWDEHGPLCLGVQTRDQKELLLLEADPQSGATSLLLKETDPVWVNLRQDVPRWLADNKGFLWASEHRTQGWQLEWRRRHGELERIVVPPDFGFRSLVHVEPESGRLAFSSRPDPSQWQVYRTTVTEGPISNLTPQPGCHGGQFDRHQTVYVDTASSLQSMPRTTIHRIDGTKLGQLPSVAEEPPFTPRVEIVKVGGEPGVYTALVRPANFEPKKRYPVIVEVYGGPLPATASGVVVASMASWLRSQWIANQGFIVVSVDGRGTPGRGHDWERAISKKFGSVPMADQIAGLKALGERFPELDLDRVGMYGWSFGGYMAALAVLREPGVFKAAVAGAPPTDWYDYDTHYTERYLGFRPLTPRPMRKRLSCATLRN